MNPIKYIAKTFSRVDPQDVADRELNQARLDLLQAETGVEYSMSLVEFNKKRVKRLESYIFTKTPVTRNEPN